MKNAQFYKGYPYFGNLISAKSGYQNYFLFNIKS